MNDEQHDFDILPAGEMQRRFGMYAESYRPKRLDPAKIPADLHDLIPWAERFGVSCDITRHDLGEKTSQQEKDALSNALRGRHARINEWTNASLPLDGSVPEVTDEEDAFTSLCVFEQEENGGPGPGGLPEWYVLKSDALYERQKRQRFVQASVGADCPNCGKPLRTRKAKQCFQCGWSGYS